ncbi:putative Response regulator receiver protein [Syntrophobacter sp. SbD1]|nr:putative Response regulator receiver protein [Syntrophobacter sp. SbD1]
MNTKPSPAVAILDEDGDDRLLLQQAFELCRQDIEVHSFEVSEGLLGYLHEQAGHGKHGGAADLVILGLHLPWEFTFDLIATIKSDPGLRQIPIIVLIGLVPDALIKRFYDLGANTVITRPVLWDELLSVLKKTCDYWFGPLHM